MTSAALVRGRVIDLNELASDIFAGRPPSGAFYAFLRINRDWIAANPAVGSGQAGSSSWTMVEYLIKAGRIGCVPGVDFGPRGEGYIRFCFARDRRELTGALESMKTLFGVHA